MTGCPVNYRLLCIINPKTHLFELAYKLHMNSKTLEGGKK